MKTRIVSAAIVCIALLGVVTPASAHRLDEYLEAATFSLTQDHIVLRLRLTAGVTAATKVLALLDSDGNGVISAAEQRTYADAVRRDLSVGVDGRDIPLTLISSTFPQEAEMRGGLGDIILTFTGALPGGATARHLAFENRHQRTIAAYLVNTLVPGDPAIRVLAQERARDQSSYRLDYTVGALATDAQTSLTLGDDIALVRTYVWHGVHHILTGFDHLLFLAALVLGAATLWDLVKVVTAFTIAHSITLTFAALGLVHLPSAIVEPLIAASIVFVAVQNVFWPNQSHGRSRLVVAFSFGLFHGLGFAGGLLEIMHQMPTSMVVLAIFGFSLGVEAGNQMVLLPLFSLLKAARARHPADESRRYAYSMIGRIGSAAVSVAGVYYLCMAL